jgi:uncharacterized protein YdhG (YjbR/CyaY superfamily)
MAASTRRPPAPTSIDDYLALLDAAQRAALERLRDQIQAAAPEAQACISYGIPAFRLDGRMLIWFGAAAGHCALYGVEEAACADVLAGYDTSGKGTVRFPADHTVPTALVEQVVAARRATLDARRSARGARKA